MIDESTWRESIEAGCLPAGVSTVREGLEALGRSGAGELIYSAGLKWPDFDFSRGQSLVVALKDSELLYRCGWMWRGFDVASGMEALCDLASARLIYLAGLNWRGFDFKMGQEALQGRKDPEQLFYAGQHWRDFDFEMGLKSLLAMGEPESIYRAGTRWRVFDYAAAWAVLEESSFEGARWREEAFYHKVWRKALQCIWSEKVGAPAPVSMPEGALEKRRTGGSWAL